MPRPFWLALQYSLKENFTNINAPLATLDPYLCSMRLSRQQSSWRELQPKFWELFRPEISLRPGTVHRYLPLGLSSAQNPCLRAHKLNPTQAARLFTVRLTARGLGLFRRSKRPQQ